MFEGSLLNHSQRCSGLASVGPLSSLAALEHEHLCWSQDRRGERHVGVQAEHRTARQEDGEVVHQAALQMGVKVVHRARAREVHLIEHQFHDQGHVGHSKERMNVFTDAAGQEYAGLADV